MLDTTIHVFLSYLRVEKGLSHNTILAYGRDLKRFDEFLTARKIGTEVYYPIPLHLQPCFVHFGYREGDLPEAERAAKEVWRCPCSPN